MSRPPDDVATQTASPRELPPDQVAEIVSLGWTPGECAVAEDALCGLAGPTYRVGGDVTLGSGARREGTSGETGQGRTVGVTREW